MKHPYAMAQSLQQSTPRRWLSHQSYVFHTIIHCGAVYVRRAYKTHAEITWILYKWKSLTKELYPFIVRCLWMYRCSCYFVYSFVLSVSVSVCVCAHNWESVRCVAEVREKDFPLNWPNCGQVKTLPGISSKSVGSMTTATIAAEPTSS